MTTKIIGVTAMLVLVGGGSLSAADQSERITLLVRLVDYAQLPGAIRPAAQDQVTRIFAAAGVTVAWTADPADWRAVDVLVLSDAMSDRKINTESIPAGVLGQAAHSVRRAYILTERVMDLANHVGVDPGDALGDVIAHELGHLLLGENAHSASGIMARDYAIQNKASRRFTNDQGALMREYLRSRQ